MNQFLEDLTTQNAEFSKLLKYLNLKQLNQYFVDIELLLLFDFCKF